MTFLAIILGITLVTQSMAAQNPTIFAHKDGCHRWHSCPSDNGSYVCGDLGHDDECPKKSKSKKEDSKKSDKTKSKGKKDKSKSESDVKSTSKSKTKTDTKASNFNTTSNPVLPSPAITEGIELSGPVTYIVDGDTLDLSGSIRIRLALVNTPEEGQEGFESAKKFVEDLCLSKNGEVDIDNGQRQGSFGRDIGVIYCDGTNLNEALMNNSLATVSTEFCEVSEFADEVWTASYCSTSPSAENQTAAASPILSERLTSAEEASTPITETEQEGNNGNDNINSDPPPKKFEVKVILDNVTVAESDTFRMRVIVYGPHTLNKPTLDKPGQLVNVQGCGSSCYTDWDFTASKVPIGSEIQACVWNPETGHQNCGYGKSDSLYGPEIIRVNLPSVS
jgi:endonuclease YncB( thermonuclease family)